jgi:hypothetical protein
LAVLRAECAGLHAKLLHCVGVGRRVAVVAHLGDVVAAIQIESYAALPPSMEPLICTSSIYSPVAVVGVPVGFEVELLLLAITPGVSETSGVDVAVDQGKTDDLVRLDGPPNTASDVLTWSGEL